MKRLIAQGVCLFSAAALLPAPAPAQDSGVTRMPRERATVPQKSAVPTRDTIRPLTRQGSLLIGQPDTPGGNKVYYYFQQYDQAMKGLAKTSTAYHERLSTCQSRAYTPQEQASAGCQQTDTVAACSEKLLAWCAAAEREPYRQALSEVAAAARRLSKEAALDADNRLVYMRTP